MEPRKNPIIRTKSPSFGSPVHVTDVGIVVHITEGIELWDLGIVVATHTLGAVKIHYY